MRFITPILSLLTAALWAVLGRIFAQTAVEKAIAYLIFRAAHWLAKRTSNTVDDELVQLLEAQYYGKATPIREQVRRELADRGGSEPRDHS